MIDPRLNARISTFEEIKTWGITHGWDTVPGYIEASLTHLKRSEKEQRLRPTMGPKQFIVNEPDLVEVCRVLSDRAPALAKAFEEVCRSQELSPGPASHLQGHLITIRKLGWSVAVHNDYKLNGDNFTFWLFTHPSGKFIKGEGRTDAEALSLIISQLEKSHDEA